MDSSFPVLFVAEMRCHLREKKKKVRERILLVLIFRDLNGPLHVSFSYASFLILGLFRLAITRSSCCYTQGVRGARKNTCFESACSTSGAVGLRGPYGENRTSRQPIRTRDSVGNRTGEKKFSNMFVRYRDVFHFTFENRSCI